MISMAAMMGGTMRSPLTAMLFTLELTHDLNILPGLLVSCIAAHAFTVLTMRRSILTEKIARRGFHITREYSVDPLATLRVEDVMDGEAPVISANMKVSELADLIARHDPRVSKRQGTLILDEAGKVVGIITRGDIVRALGNASSSELTVLEAGSKDLLVAYPDEVLHDAVTRMVRHGIGRLPVVSRGHPHNLLGYLGRAALMAARLRRVEEEHDRERGWLQGPTSTLR
jgi:CBS domain-containing protein